MTRVGFALRSIGMAALFVCATPSVARATDYDVRSNAWNGLQELVRIAQTSEVDLRPTDDLDWRDVRRGDGLLIVYPLAAIDLNDLSNFLEEGGRLALMDDFGRSDRLLRWFQVARNDAVQGDARSSQMPGLLIAYRRSEHALAEGVDTLVTNEPVALWHPRLPPIFALSDDPRQGIVVAGQVGRGRLVVSGDPSVLINTMMRFAGNRQFARNLLVYLAEHRGGRVHLIHSRFSTHGLYRGRGRARTPAREFVENVNDALGRISTLLGEQSIVRFLSLLVALCVCAAVTARMWGRKPSDRFGPTGPAGAAASSAEKVALFSARGANMLYPVLVAKRYFERSLLRAVGLRPPTDVGAVLAQAKNRIDSAQQSELRAILIELDSLATPSHEGGPSRVSAPRFLSLWRRIGAILTALESRS